MSEYFTMNFHEVAPESFVTDLVSHYGWKLIIQDLLLQTIKIDLHKIHFERCWLGGVIGNWEVHDRIPVKSNDFFIVNSIIWWYKRLKLRCIIYDGSSNTNKEEHFDADDKI
jgi:hypothetical protein